MKVEFWGAAQTVTGSMHLVHFQGKQLLLECGLYQGKRKEAFQRNRELPFNPQQLDAVVLSHAHLDHSGNLPTLVRNGFRGKIYSTSATRDLAAHLLLDSANIQESDVRYVNKQRKASGKQLFEPLYVTDDSLRTIKQFRSQEFEEPFTPVPGITCSFHVAGHMLGAAIIRLQLDDGNGQPLTLVFSGDLGRANVPILQNPVQLREADYLIMEATYGDRTHPSSEDTDEILFRAAHETYQSKGKLIVPAFSIGRTQEIVYRLNLLAERGRLPPMQVFVDSPLAVDATGVYREHVECFDQQFVDQISREGDQDPLGFRNLHYIRKAEYSKELNRYAEPCIIISASGMCEGGRVLHHLKHNIEKPNTTILFAGFQAPYTLGRQILDGQKTVRIFGEQYQVRAQICRLEGSSGHADQVELLQWAQGISAGGRLKHLALVHCEMQAAEVLAQKLTERGIQPVTIPARGQSLSLPG